MDSISVIIPTYNRSQVVVRAVESALSAIDIDDEIIVVDDGSTDDTQAILSPYLSRIRYLMLPHRGAGASRNAGVTAARCPLIAFLDSDDAFMPERFALQRLLMRSRPELVFCCSDFCVRLPDGSEHHSYLHRWMKRALTWEQLFGPAKSFSEFARLPLGIPECRVYFADFYIPLLLEPCVCAITLLVRRERAGGMLWFAEDVPTYEDWECAARIARVGPGAFLECETAWNYGHDGSRLTDATFLERATTRLKILERVWGQDPLFLAKHELEYNEACRDTRLTRARCLLQEGKVAEFQLELKMAKRIPLQYRAAAFASQFAVGRGLLEAVLALRRIIITGMRAMHHPGNAFR